MARTLFITLFFTLLFTISVNYDAKACSGCAAGFSGGGGPGGGGGECSNDAWVDKLVGQESGGDYSIQAPNSSATGRYQFIDGTRSTIGSANGLPCASGAGSRSGFASCPALQDAYFNALVQENINLTGSACASNCGQTRDGCEVTESGLAAIAHNVGPTCANLWARGGRALMESSGPQLASGQKRCHDANGTDPISKYGCAMGGYDMGGGPSANGCDPQQPTESNPVPFQGHLIGCDPAILNGNEAKKEALQQMETEAAKALITKPTSVMQLTCFEQYTKKVHENIGKIHSKPAEGISGTIVPNVEIPAINFTMDNFLSSVMSGGLQSMMNNALSSLTGGLGGGSGDNCNAMDEMWKILECIDFPKMPSLSDIMGGNSGAGGILGNLGGGGSGGGGIMGAVCEAASSLFGGGSSGGSGGSGGGSGATDVFNNLRELNQEPQEDNSGIYDEDNNSTRYCDYTPLLPQITDMRADLNRNNIIEETELRDIDTIYGNGNCRIEDEELNMVTQRSSGG